MFEVLAAPPHCRIEDAGRRGWRHLGAPLSGPLDRIGMHLANALVGNDGMAAALEMRLPGLRLRALAPQRIACAHGAVQIISDAGVVVAPPPWRAMAVAAGDEVRITALDGGVAYLAVGGGLAAPQVLGSRSVCERLGFGAATTAGMQLTAEATPAGPLLYLPAPPQLADEGPLRVLAPPQPQLFTAAAHGALYGAEFRVSAASDRMGMRLEGPRLEHAAGADILSDATTPGVIQVPGDGGAIILLADCQSLGGYARIGVVISADLPRLGRLVAGAPLRFVAVDIDAALAALRAEHEQLAALLASMRPASGDSVDLQALYHDNLVSGAIHAQ